jgi:surface polysaccharide O-acyltransferase-like enzyme
MKNRVVYIDLLRILAIYLVAFNHTGDRGYMLFADSAGSALYLPYMAFSVLCKIAVPIFFMISGALLLPKEESFKQLFQKRVLRMAVVLILVSVPYYYIFLRENGIGVSSFFTYIYEHSATTALWYLYSYIGLLLLLPFLRSMVKGMRQKDFIYLLIGHIVLVGILPCLEYLIWGGSVTLNGSFSSVLFVTQNMFFALMGYYLEHVWKENKRSVIVGIILSAVSIVATCLITYLLMVREGTGSAELLESFFNCFVCIPAMTVYCGVKSVSSKIKSQRVQKLLPVFGSAVFGVYLIEKLVRLLTRTVYTAFSPFVGSFIASLVWCFATCCLAFLIIIPLKHIPGIKKLVNKFI